MGSLRSCLEAAFRSRQLLTRVGAIATQDDNLVFILGLIFVFISIARNRMTNSQAGGLVGICFHIHCSIVLGVCASSMMPRILLIVRRSAVARLLMVLRKTWLGFSTCVTNVFRSIRAWSGWGR